MFRKVNGHFHDWSRRASLLLGKTQIIKTFGTSQYLYALMLIDLSPEQWQIAQRFINKFI